MLLIIKREFLDHLMSMRLGLTVALTVALMAVNAVLFAGGEFGERMRDYQDGLGRTGEWIERHADQLAHLGVRGPGWLVKRPSPLVFCAGGRDEFLPREIFAHTSSSTSSSQWGVTIHYPWRLRYETPTSPPVANIVSDFVGIDWVFIIGFVLSLMALLLSYDGICGERERGWGAWAEPSRWLS